MLALALWCTGSEDNLIVNPTPYCTREVARLKGDEYELPKVTEGIADPALLPPFQCSSPTLLLCLGLLVVCSWLPWDGKSINPSVRRSEFRPWLFKSLWGSSRCKHHMSNISLPLFSCDHINLESVFCANRWSERNRLCLASYWGQEKCRTTEEVAVGDGVRFVVEAMQGEISLKGSFLIRQLRKIWESRWKLKTYLSGCWGSGHIVAWNLNLRKCPGLVSSPKQANSNNILALHPVCRTVLPESFRKRGFHKA